MKRIIPILVLLLVVCMSADAQSWRTGGKKKKRSSARGGGGDFTERLWVGGNINNLRFGSNFFSFGLTPMAGVKVIDNVSLGVMVKVDYFTQRTAFTPRIRFSSLDFGPTGFLRFVVAKQFFGQAEYERAFLQRPTIIVNNRWEKETLQQNYLYVGAGILRGSGPWYTTISIHYNVLDDIDSVRFQWDYRFGIIYEFGEGGDIDVDDGKRRRRR